MRTALAVAAFAAGALAVPYKREVVTDVAVVYVTNVVTVTGGQPTPSVASNVKQVSQKVHHHHNHHQNSVSVSAETSVVVQATSAPAPSAFTSVVSAPAAPAPFSAIASVASAAAPAAAPTGYQEIVLYHHNLHRQNHSAPDLEWDSGLESSAQTIASSCVYAHNTEVDGGGYGQNIAAGVEAANISSVITDMFYNGEEPYFASNYGQASPDMSLFEKWGHFSQVVWAGTTHVACATQYCPSGLANTGGGVSPYFTVCNYKNPGNYDGEYASNVLAPKGMATVSWSAGLQGQ